MARPQPYPVLIPIPKRKQPPAAPVASDEPPTVYTLIPSVVLR